MATNDLERVRSKRLQREKILNLYTSHDCWYHDVCLKAYRIQDYGPGRLRFLSPEFEAFGISWKLSGTIVSVEKNPARPTLGDDRAIELQLVATTPLYDTNRDIDYAVLKSAKVTQVTLGQNGKITFQTEVELVPTQYHHRFTDESPESPKNRLELKVVDDYNKLIGAQCIFLRLVMKRIINTNENIQFSKPKSIHKFFGE